jgi:hypothetical protein
VLARGCDILCCNFLGINRESFARVLAECREVRGEELLLFNIFKNALKKGLFLQIDKGASFALRKCTLPVI